MRLQSDNRGLATLYVLTGIGLASAQDAHLSHLNNRQSAVMARLTLISTIFLPLNFVAGFFGMNLEIIPPHTAIPLVLTSMVTLPVGLYLFFRSRRWL